MYIYCVYRKETQLFSNLMKKSIIQFSDIPFVQILYAREIWHDEFIIDKRYYRVHFSIHCEAHLG